MQGWQEGQGGTGCRALQGRAKVQPALPSGDRQCHRVTPRCAVGQRQSTCLLGPGPRVRERAGDITGPGIYGKPSPRLLGCWMRMPASFAAPWGSTAFWVQQLGLWPCRTPPLGLGTLSLLLPWALGGCAVRSEGRAGPSGWAQSPGLESLGRGRSWSIMWGDPWGCFKASDPPTP